MARSKQDELVKELDSKHSEISDISCKAREQIDIVRKDLDAVTNEKNKLENDNNELRKQNSVSIRMYKLVKSVSGVLYVC